MATFLMHILLLTTTCVRDKWKGNEFLGFHDNESYVRTINCYVVLELPKLFVVFVQ